MEYREQHFSAVEYADDISGNEYSGCSFEQCRLAGISLLDVVFDNCVFTGCTFRNVDVSGLRMQNAIFRDSAFIGIDWSEVRRLGKLFPLIKEVAGCTLKYNTFVKTKMPKTRFSDSSIVDCAFLECNFSGSIFHNVDFQDTVFQECDLSKADFREARNYRINTDSNRVAKAKFSLPEVVGLLNSFDIIIE